MSLMSPDCQLMTLREFDSSEAANKRELLFSLMALIGFRVSSTMWVTTEPLPVSSRTIVFLKNKNERKMS